MVPESEDVNDVSADVFGLEGVGDGGPVVVGLKKGDVEEVGRRMLRAILVQLESSER